MTSFNTADSFADPAMVWRGFASDNYAGVHPEVMSAIADANHGHQVAYGDDVVTAQFDEMIRHHFGAQAVGFPVFNGTGANVIALQAICRSWEAVICASTAHINVDEGGAPEKVAGLKLHLVTTPDGKLTPELVDIHAFGFGEVHRAQPRVVSITQSTEMGTLYTVEEVRALADHAHSLGMYLHLDGARISNATVALGCEMQDFTTKTGVDAVSLGATKNGALGAEAVVMLNPEFADSVKYLRKSAMQLSSKMRFNSAQLIAMFGGDLYLRNARHANEMAAALYREVKDVPGIEFGGAPQVNSLFPILPPSVTAKLQEKFKFYIWDYQTGQVRWMCSWDTTAEDVAGFAKAIKQTG